MQESPLLSRKVHKSGAFEAVRPLRNQSWGYFPKSPLRDLQGPNRPQSRNQLHPRETLGRGVRLQTKEAEAAVSSIGT